MENISAPIRVAAVGLGPRGLHMLKLAATFSGVEAVAGCDIQQDLVETASKDLPQMRRYTDFQTMLKAGGIDVLLVETPATCHAEFCAEGLKAGLHVYSDVPTVASLEEAKMIWEVSQSAKGMFMFGANPNEWGFVESLHDLWKQGMLGVPYYLEAEYIHDARAMFEKTPWRRTLPPIKYCTHSLGPLLRLMEDRELRTVSCVSTGSFINHFPGENDLQTAHFQTEDGAILRLTISFVNNAGCGYHSYRVFGTEGYFERMAQRGSRPSYVGFKSTKLYGAQSFVQLPVNEERPEYAKKMTADQKSHGGADYVLLAKLFEAIRTNAPSPISLREGLRMSLPGIFAEESAKRGGETVRISYPWEADFPVH